MTLRIALILLHSLMAESLVQKSFCTEGHFHLLCFASARPSAPARLALLVFHLCISRIDCITLSPNGRAVRRQQANVRQSTAATVIASGEERRRQSRARTSVLALHACKAEQRCSCTLLPLRSTAEAVTSARSRAASARSALNDELSLQ